SDPDRVESFGACLGVSLLRIGIRQRAAIRKVAEFRYKTCCAPISAIRTPLMAGPNRMPMLVVLWRRAFAETSSDLLTSNGTANPIAGPNTVETVAVRKMRM